MFSSFIFLSFRLLPGWYVDLRKIPGKPSLDRAITALLIGIGCLLFLLGFRVSIVALGMSILVASLFVYFVATRIGGQTGDVLGAAQQITEITILLAIIMVGME